MVLEFNGYEYAIDHGDNGIRVIGNNCSKCYCNNGQFEDCQNITCPFGSSTDNLQSCDINGRTYYHGETFEDDCNMCICVNANIVCTSLACADEDESSDGGAVCHRSVHQPVCGINLRTYPNLCAAQAAGLNQLEIIQGPCTREVCTKYVVLHVATEHIYACMAVNDSFYCKQEYCVIRFAL